MRHTMTKTKTMTMLVLGMLLVGCGGEEAEIGQEEAALVGCYPTIDAKYQALGGAAALGLPLIAESVTAAGDGKHRVYERGVIYQKTGRCAWVVMGGILAKWNELGRERGVLGWPVSDEEWVSDNWGRVSQFEGGTIYWSPGWGAAAMRNGKIRDKWLALGGVRSPLGYPVRDQLLSGAPGAWSQEFAWGAIYYPVLAPSGPFAVQGGIGQLYRELGGANGIAGLPTTDEYNCWPSTLGTRCQQFKNGLISWTAAAGPIFRR